MASFSPDGTRFDITGEGPAVVLVHGLGMRLEMWQWQLSALSKKYRVITYDLLGHGSSSPPPTPPTLTLFSEQIVGLLTHLNIEQSAVVGFSLGGMIARRFAIDHSERLSALAILNSPHDRTQEQRNAILKRVNQSEKEGTRGTVEPALQRWFTDEYRKDNPEIMNLIREWILSNDQKVYPKIYRVLAASDEELVVDLPNVTHPTLVMTGEEDFGNSVEMSVSMAKSIPNAELVILSNLRHMALAEAPELVNDALVSFLDKSLLQSS